MNTLEDKYKSLFGAYLGIRLLDEYPLKEYVMQDIKKYIDNFMKEYPLNIEFNEYLNLVDNLESEIVKLQDLLRIGIILDFSIELRKLIKDKIKEISHEKY